jgi:hypothetical protein
VANLNTSVRKKKQCPEKKTNGAERGTLQRVNIYIYTYCIYVHRFVLYAVQYYTTTTLEVIYPSFLQHAKYILSLSTLCMVHGHLSLSLSLVVISIGRQ